MKRILTFLLAVCLLLSCALAAGDPNLNGGGGDIGEGTEDNIWSGGDDVLQYHNQQLLPMTEGAYPTGCAPLIHTFL